MVHCTEALGTKTHPTMRKPWYSGTEAKKNTEEKTACVRREGERAREKKVIKSVKNVATCLGRHHTATHF